MASLMDKLKISKLVDFIVHESRCANLMLILSSVGMQVLQGVIHCIILSYSLPRAFDLLMHINFSLK